MKNSKLLELVQRNKANLEFLYTRNKNLCEGELAFSHWLNLISFYLERGHYPNAQEIVEDAFSYFQSPLKRLEISYQKSIILYRTGNTNQAIELLEILTKQELVNSNQGQFILMKILSFLSVILKELNQIERADRYSQKVDALLQNTSQINVVELLSILKHRGFSNYKEGKIDEALVQFKDLEKIYQKSKINRPLLLAEIYEKIGLCYQKKGHYNGAFDNYFKARVINENQGFTQGLVQNLNQLSNLCAQFKFYEDACIQAQNAIQLTRRVTEVKSFTQDFAFREKYAEAGMNYIFSLCSLNNASKAIAACETHQYSILYKQLVKKHLNHKSFVKLDKLQYLLEEDEIVLYFPHIQFNTVTVIGLTKSNIQVFQTNIERQLENIFNQFQEDINKLEIKYLEEEDEKLEHLISNNGYSSKNISKRLSKIDRLFRFFTSLLMNTEFIDFNLKYSNDLEDFEEARLELEALSNSIYNCLISKELESFMKGYKTLT